MKKLQKKPTTGLPSLNFVSEFPNLFYPVVIDFWFDFGSFYTISFPTVPSKHTVKHF